jgi:hypothetical protein
MVAPAGVENSTAWQAGRGCRAQAEAIVVLVAARGCCMVVDWLLAVDRGDWRCSATVSAAWDCVGGWCLRQRHRGMIRLAADHGGLLSLVGATWCGTASEDCSSDFIGLLLWWRWLGARMKQRGEVDLRRRLGCLVKILGSGASLLTTLTVILETDLGRGVLWWAWRGPRARCFLRGVEREVEFNGGCGEAPARCVVAVATVRQVVRGPNPVFFPLHRVDCDVAAVSRRRVLHGGGLLGAVVSASFDSYRRRVTPAVSTTIGVWTVGGCCGSASAFAAVVEWSGAAALISQSN